MQKKLNTEKRLNRRLVSFFLILTIIMQMFIIYTPVFADLNNIEAGSLIIPMDVTYQNMGMWKAYGLVNELLRRGIPVSWAIASVKNFNATDFTANTNDYRTNAAVGTYAYSGGPFIIRAADVSRAAPIISAWWLKTANQPTIHIALASFSANIDIVLRSAPRIATEETNASIAINYYNTAGITDLNGNVWTTLSPNILNQSEILSGALFYSGECSERRFDTFVTPHNGGYSYSLTDPANLGTRTYAMLDYFVNQGGGWTALCHSILSNENAIADLYNHGSSSVKALFKSTLPGGFLTTTGFADIANKSGTWTVTAANLPIAQAVATNPGVIQALPGGSVQTWDRNIVTYYPQTEKIAHFKLGSVFYDWAINGVAHGGTTLGKVTYLGGHSYSTSLPYSANAHAPYLRFFYNSLFFNGSAVAKLDLTTSVNSVPFNYPSAFTVNLSNKGSSTATNTNNVTITLAPGMLYTSMTTGPEPSVSFSDGRTILSWGSSLGAIAADSTALKINVSFTATSLDTIKIAHLSAQYGDVYGEAFEANLCRAINVSPAPNPLISKTPDYKEYYPGQIATWDILYSNSGQSTLYNSVVEDILPAGFSFQSSVPTPVSVVPLPDGTVRIRWNAGTMAAGASGTIKLSAYTPKSMGSFTNNVKLYGNDLSGFNYQKQDTADVMVIPPAITLNKSVIPSGPVDLTAPGQFLTYTLRPYYGGSQLLSNVLISDPIPAYTTYVNPSLNAGGIYGFTGLPRVDGLDDTTFINRSTSSSITISPSTVILGGLVNITLTIFNNSGGTINSVVPYVMMLREGATISSPSPTGPVNIANGNSATFTFTATMTEIGERVFIGGAISNAGTDTEYSFPEASSNSVLVTSSLNTSPLNDVVTWRLGSNTAPISGETITSGYTSGVYAFRGAGSTEFSKYSMSPTSSNWLTKPVPPGTILKGGALTTDGNGTIYASKGDSTAFYKYSIDSTTGIGIWSTLAPAPSKFDEGGGIQYLTVGGVQYVFALLGNSKLFYRYNIADNNWTRLTDTAQNIKKGGALTTDGTYLYALRGDGKTDFYRYNIGTNTWSGTPVIAVVPANVRWGGALATVGGNIYAFRGDGKKDFWRYNIATNTWTAMAPAPGVVKQGGALTNDGTTIYALQGNTLGFWSYNIVSNTWSALSSVNFTAAVGQGGALVYINGINPQGRYTNMSTNAGLVTSGDTIKVRLSLNSSFPVTSFILAEPIITATNGASALKVTNPVRINAADDLYNFVYECDYQLISGALPGSVTFSCTSATGISGGVPVTFPTATSRSVLVTPELTYQVQLFNAGSIPETVTQVLNQAMVSDRTVLGYGINSNATATPLLRPKLTLLKINSPQGEVHHDAEISYTLVVKNEGAGRANNIILSDIIPQYTSFIAGSVTYTGSASVTGRITKTEPSGSNPLIINITYLDLDEFVEITFKVLTIAQPDAGTYIINNYATATASGVAQITSNLVSNTMTLAASFSVLKYALEDAVMRPGDIIHYTINVINNGDVRLGITGLSDPMISSLVYSTGDINGNAFFDPGEIWFYTGTYTVKKADLIFTDHTHTEECRHFLVNTVTVTTAQAGSQTATSEVEIIVGLTAKIRLKKEVTGTPPVPGEEFIVQLTGTDMKTSSVLHKDEFSSYIVIEPDITEGTLFSIDEIIPMEYQLTEVSLIINPESGGTVPVLTGNLTSGYQIRVYPENDITIVVKNQYTKKSFFKDIDSVINQFDNS